MHTKYAKDGLAVVTVNVDAPDDKETRKKVTDFLRQQKATFTNLVLADKEDPNAWFDRHKLEAFPTSFVYNRAGKLEQRFEGADPEAVEKVVVEQLKK